MKPTIISVLMLLSLAGMGQHDVVGKDSSGRGYLIGSGVTARSAYPGVGFGSVKWTYSWPTSGDTLDLSQIGLSHIRFIKIGDNVYRVTSPEIVPVVPHRLSGDQYYIPPFDWKSGAIRAAVADTVFITHFDWSAPNSDSTITPPHKKKHKVNKPVKHTAPVLPATGRVDPDITWDGKVIMLSIDSMNISNSIDSIKISKPKK